MSVLVILSVFLLLVWGFTLYAMQREKQLAVHSAGAAQHNLSVAIAESLRQLLQRGVSYAEAVSRQERAGINRLSERLSELRSGDAAYNRLALSRLDGKLLYESSPAETEGMAEFVRKNAAAFAADVPPSLLIVPSAYVADSQAWLLPLLLPVYSANGKVESLLEVDLDLGYLLRLYQRLDFGKVGEIRIHMADGLELARVSHGGLEVRRSQAQATLSKEHVTSVHPVAGYALQVVVSQPVEDILDELVSGSHRPMSSLLLSIMVVGMMFWTVHLLRQHRDYLETLLQSEAEKQQLIVQLEGEKHHAYELAARDYLTGLFNRRMFIELANSHLASARRKRQVSAIMFVDLDRFKSINDTLGHNVGDLLLKVIATRLRESLRESDIIARFGGDEFVIMLPALDDESNIEMLAAKLAETLSQPCLNLDGHTVQTSPSIGIAVYPRDGTHIEALLLNADSAMYQAKTGGRGNYVFFDPSIKNNSTLEFELEQNLQSAIENNEFVLHYQPKIDMSDFRIIGFEALIRWQHPRHGLIFPNTFIPLAEASGHIAALGRWVIEASCRQLAAWREVGMPLLPVSINLSGRQFHDRKLTDKIVAALEYYELNTALLEVEVTESSLIENLELASSTLASLDAIGVRIALDDFGTGFSSLGYIKALPINTIKIDRAFIRDINNSQDDAVIVTSVIALAHNLGMQVVAEGVETRDQLVYLKTAGCDQVQGYLFSRPVPADKVAALIEKFTEVFA